MRRLVLFIVMVFAAVASSAQPRTPSVPTPEGIKPGSITCEDVPYPFPGLVPAADALRPGRAHRVHGRGAARPAERPLGRAVSRQQLRRVLFRLDDRGAAQGRVPGDRARSDRLRPIVEADHPVQLPRHGAQHAPDPGEPEDRQGDDRRPLDGRHARGALRDAVPRRRPSGWCSTTRSASPIRATAGRGRAPTRATSGRSPRPIRPSAPASCATSRTTRRRGRRSSKPTPASATPGRSAPTGRAWRWCRR